MSNAHRKGMPSLAETRALRVEQLILDVRQLLREIYAINQNLAEVQRDRDRWKAQAEGVHKALTIERARLADALRTIQVVKATKARKRGNR